MFLTGIFIVILAVFGGYFITGAKMAILWQPSEFIIIGGAAAGSYILGNTKEILKKTSSAFKILISAKTHTKKEYIELLSLLYTIFRLAKFKGLLSLEQHIENPKDSDIFTQYPKILKNEAALNFICDYLRILTMGVEDFMLLEESMDKEIETINSGMKKVADALQTMADATPAFGIVAAVLGVIKTMSAITEPPEILGHMIGGALVGTFLGVFLAYGFFGPFAHLLKTINAENSKYFTCIKASLSSHIHGAAPAISVEFGRKTLPLKERPSFYEVEEATSNIG